MIAIINDTEREGKGVYGYGTQFYRVQINEKFLFNFEHNFSDGLAACLEKAAEAAVEWEWKEEIRKQDEVVQFFTDIEKEGTHRWPY